MSPDTAGSGIRGNWYFEVLFGKNSLYSAEQFSMKNGTVLAIISDTHVGSSTALAPLEFTVHNRSDDERQVTKANKLQTWLYECWTDYWNYVFKLSKKKRLIVVHVGDLIDGVHNQSTQLMPEVEDQMQVALDLMKPIVAKADGFFGILGTGVHAGQDNSYEALLYRQLGAKDFDQHLTLNVDGYIHTFYHHGRAGQRPWTSSAAGVASEIMLDFAQAGLQLPNFIWSAHNHRVDDSGSKFIDTRAISLPSWQLKTSFGWRVSPGTVRSDIGGFIVIDGHIIDDSRSRYRGQPDKRKIIIA